MLTVLSIIGTRPEAIKMAPVIRRLQGHPGEVLPVVCSTGQHRDLLGQVYSLFGIVPDVELNVMQPNQSLSTLTARLLQGLDATIQQVHPDWVLAQGDTTTVLAASLAAYYQGVPFGHVEAGLRTGDRYHPFPEEVNRRAADAVAELMFAPTELSRQNLLREGHPDARIVVTGNTVIDALQMVAAMPYQWSSGPLAGIPADKRLVLVTAHRRESFGEPLRELCTAIQQLAEHYAGEGVHFVYPVHPNPNVREPVAEILGSSGNISLLAPLDYLSLVHLMKRCCLVVTDSGGIQEEAPGLGIPVLVTREKTERPEGVAAGIVKLVGTGGQRIRAEAMAILDDPAAHAAMARGANLYGDGNAAQRIVSALLKSKRAARRNAVAQ
jgi:UDP-N-acetylglucosamine 2-epimerase (non-hydrolysing)